MCHAHRSRDDGDQNMSHFSGFILEYGG